MLSSSSLCFTHPDYDWLTDGPDTCRLSPPRHYDHHPGGWRIPSYTSTTHHHNWNGFASEFVQPSFLPLSLSSAAAAALSLLLSTTSPGRTDYYASSVMSSPLSVMAGILHSWLLRNSRWVSWENWIFLKMLLRFIDSNRRWTTVLIRKLKSMLRISSYQQ